MKYLAILHCTTWVSCSLWWSNSTSPPHQLLWAFYACYGCSAAQIRNNISSVRKAWKGMYHAGTHLRLWEKSCEIDSWVLYTSLTMICWVRLGILLPDSGEVSTFTWVKHTAVLNTSDVKPCWTVGRWGAMKRCFQSLKIWIPTRLYSFVYCRVFWVWIISCFMCLLVGITWGKIRKLPLQGLLWQY